MMLTATDLVSLCPSTPQDHLELFVEPLAATFEEFKVNTPARQAAFLAQYAYETNGFTRLLENLNFTTVDALVAATKPRWNALDRDDAWGYLRQPERLANRIYANRFGNGDAASGDGWKFRGRGLCHLTFHDNYFAAGEALGVDLVADPDAITGPVGGCRVGGWYWESHDCNYLADHADFHGITLAINGGLNGYQHRIALHDRAKEVLA